MRGNAATGGLGEELDGILNSILKKKALKANVLEWELCFFHNEINKNGLKKGRMFNKTHG
jgi:hypothetical protein